MKSSKTKNAASGRYTTRTSVASNGSSRTVKDGGNGYRSAKTGRFISSNAPRLKSSKARSTAVGQATNRVKATAAVDVVKSRRSK